jgi:hypothetical protein
MFGEFGYAAAYVHWFYVLSCCVERHVDFSIRALVGPLHIVLQMYRVGHKSLTTLCKSQSMRNRWITTICDLIRPSRSPHLMTSPRPNKVTYGCYPSIPHALRFTKGGKGLVRDLCPTLYCDLYCSVW